MLLAEAREFPWSPLRPDAEMQIITVNGDVAIACRGVGRIDGVAEGEEMKSGVSSHFMPGARHSELPWRRYIGLLKTHGMRVLTEYGSRLKRLCRRRLAEARAIRPLEFQSSDSGAPAVALQAWMRPIVAVVEASAMALPPRLTWLAAVCRTRGEACLRAMASWGKQAGARLPKPFLRAKSCRL